MTNHTTFIGIDISKDYLDVHILQSSKRFRLENSKAGCSQLRKRLANLPCPAVGLEASGGYERLVLLNQLILISYTATTVAGAVAPRPRRPERSEEWP